MRTVYEAAGGESGLRRLAEAWHRRATADAEVGHAFARGFRHDHVDRLAAYWGEALGGPARYTAQYGSASDVVRMHSGNGPHAAMDRRAIACFDQALDDAGLTEPPLRGVLHDWFAWSTTHPMAAFPRSSDDVPEDLPLPRWGWNGPVDD